MCLSVLPLITNCIFFHFCKLCSVWIRPSSSRGVLSRLFVFLNMSGGSRIETAWCVKGVVNSILNELVYNAYRRRDCPASRGAMNAAKKKKKSCRIIQSVKKINFRSIYCSHFDFRGSVNVAPQTRGQRSENWTKLYIMQGIQNKEKSVCTLNTL